MTGPEHYLMAEGLASTAAKERLTPHEAATLVGLAQVHATLALAAVQDSRHVLDAVVGMDVS